MLALTDESLARVMIAATAIAPHARDGCSSSRPRSSTRRRRARRRWPRSSSHGGTRAASGELTARNHNHAQARIETLVI
jgi:hypothetical protein